MGGVSGFKHTYKGLFTEVANRLPELDPDGPAHAEALRYRQSIVADLMLDAASLDLSGSLAKTLGDGTPVDMKAFVPGDEAIGIHIGTLTPRRRETAGRSQPRLPRCGQVHRRGARSQPGSPEPVESELST